MAVSVIRRGLRHRTAIEDAAYAAFPENDSDIL